MRLRWNRLQLGWSALWSPCGCLCSFSNEITISRVSTLVSETLLAKSCQRWMVQLGRCCTRNHHKLHWIESLVPCLPVFAPTTSLPRLDWYSAQVLESMDLGSLSFAGSCYVMMFAYLTTTALLCWAPCHYFLKNFKLTYGMTYWLSCPYLRRWKSQDYLPIVNFHQMTEDCQFH